MTSAGLETELDAPGDALKILMDRWNSGEDHGNVTAEELKSLYNDWKSAREKPAKKAMV